VLLPELLFGLGCSWVLASLGVYVRDTHEVVRVVVQLLFFMCPLVCSADLVENPLLRTLLLLTPLAIAIDASRAALDGGAGPGWLAIGGLLIGTIVLAALGHAFFRRTQDGFADVL